MRFGRKAVTVRNRDEFERALATADEIVVEGDDDLRAYAEHVVSQKDNNDIGPEDSTIIVEHLSGDARFMWTELGEKSSAQHWLLGPPRPESRAAPTRIRFGLALAAAAALAVAILGAGWFFSVRIGPFPNAGPVLPSQPSSSPAAPVADLVNIGWIVVALAAIFAVYRLISKAMEGDRNVELAWKITTKVSGRLVIKKVPTTVPTPRVARRKPA